MIHRLTILIITVAGMLIGCADPKTSAEYRDLEARLQESESRNARNSDTRLMIQESARNAVAGISRPSEEQRESDEFQALKGPGTSPNADAPMESQGNPVIAVQPLVRDFVNESACREKKGGPTVGYIAGFGFDAPPDEKPEIENPCSGRCVRLTNASWRDLIILVNDKPLTICNETKAADARAFRKPGMDFLSVASVLPPNQVVYIGPMFRGQYKIKALFCTRSLDETLDCGMPQPVLNENFPSNGPFGFKHKINAGPY